MMFDDIEVELKNECSVCEVSCRKEKCLAYRLNQIITWDRKQKELIDIDRFFFGGESDQMTVFDFLGTE